MTNEIQIPLQPVEKPILSSPYKEPKEHWAYDIGTGMATRIPDRRPASYFFKVQRSANPQQLGLFAEETREDLPLVNALRADVKRWRDADYPEINTITRDLLHYWKREDRERRLFFCQLEAAETIIYLNEIRLRGRHLRFQSKVSDEDLAKLKDHPADATLQALIRLGLKMATGSGKTVVMAMLIAWSFCNRGINPRDERFPNSVLVVCPNLTIKERLQVLRPEMENNYYEEFDLVPSQHRPLLQKGKVMVTNWHLFAPESEHAEGGKSYAVVNKGAEGPEAFARRVLGDLYGRGPILVLNDEAHHAWRPKTNNNHDQLPGTDLTEVNKEEFEEATVWINGLDTLNKAVGIHCCVDLSATPFYIHGSGQIEGSPFPWLVSDFGLVDAIESGIVKIPRLPVSDTTGRPEPKYFRTWENIVASLLPGERLPGRGGRPKPDVIYEKAEPALNTLAGQWVERFKLIEEKDTLQDKIPPALIIVCDNTDIAEVFYRNISGEQVVEAVDIDVDDEDEEEEELRPKAKKQKTKVVYGTGRIFPEYFSNREGFTPTIRIDSKLLAQAETGSTDKSKQQAGEELRKIVSTVGKHGQPGEQVRCIISVAMLNEGWDANNVTNIFGLRAFTSQLLCEQVVGRGLRRMDYEVDPATGLLTEEYVDIYGVPFSLIPFKGRQTDAKAVEDRPKNRVHSLPERKNYMIKFPVVEGFVFDLRKNLITANIDEIEPIEIEPSIEPTSVFVKPRVYYQEGPAGLSGPGEFAEQDRRAFYQRNHLQTIEFEIARNVVQMMVGDNQQNMSYASDSNPKLRLLSRHQLFPQVLRIVHGFIEKKIVTHGADKREIGQMIYFRRIVERMVAAIKPDDTQGEPPLRPVLNRYKPIGDTSGVDYKTTRTVFPTEHSHMNAMTADTKQWEQSAAFYLEMACLRGLAICYARNEMLNFTIPYEHQGNNLHYEPDFLVKLSNGETLILEIKGMEDDQDRAKHQSAKRWVEAVNNWGELGEWAFHVSRDPQLVLKDIENCLK